MFFPLFLNFSGNSLFFSVRTERNALFKAHGRDTGERFDAKPLRTQLFPARLERLFDDDPGADRECTRVPHQLQQRPQCAPHGEEIVDDKDPLPFETTTS